MTADTSIDFDSFQREVRNVLSPHLGLNLNDVNTGKVLIEATKVAAKYNIRVPGDWMVVFRAIVTMEGMGRMLDPEFDMIAMGESLVKDIVQIQTSPARLTEDAFKISKDFLSLLEGLPRTLRWALRKLARNDYALELKIPEVNRLTDQVNWGSRRIARSISGTGMLFAGALIIQSGVGHRWGDYPALGLALLGMGLFFVLRPAR